MFTALRNRPTLRASKFTRAGLASVLAMAALLACGFAVRAEELEEEHDAPRAEAVPRSYLVRLKTSLKAGEHEQLFDPMGISWRRLSEGKKKGFFKQRMGPEDAWIEPFLIIELSVDQERAGVLRRIARFPQVAYVEPNYKVRTTEERRGSSRTLDGPGGVGRAATDSTPQRGVRYQAASQFVVPPRGRPTAEAEQPASSTQIPSDFEFQNLWSLRNTGQEGGKAGADIQAARAWSVTTGSASVLIAMIDTGIDYLHPDLAGNIWRNTREIPGNGIDDDGNGWIDDVHGYDVVSDDSDPLDDGMHGTHVAGIAGAVGNNGIGISGVCWQVGLMAIKAFDESGNGDLAQVIRAIHYAVANHAQIINASWGLPTRSRALEEAVRNARKQGIVFIAAAGNEGSDAPFYPAAMPEVLSVAATDRSDQRAAFSRAGPTVDLSAPGDMILSTTPNNRYDLLGGTSMAAPHVSGVAALVLSAHPEFTASEVETILKNSTDPISSDRPIGSGRINAFKAVQFTAPLPELRLDLPELLAGVVDFRGSAAGLRLVEYWIDAGAGSQPTQWVRLGGGTRAVTNGTLLASWYSPALTDGTYWIRLTGKNDNGQTSVETVQVEIRNVALLSPLNNDVIRFGGVLPILGNAFGNSVRYQVEFGEGRNPTAWNAAGMTLAGGGTLAATNAVLASWDTRGLDPTKTYALRLTASVDGRESMGDLVQVLLPDARLREGFPRHLPILNELPIEEWRHLVVEDLDRDGLKEIVFVEPGNLDDKPAKLVVLGVDGSERWSRELPGGEPLVDIPVVGDLDGDGKLEVVVEAGATHQMHAFRSDGRPMSGAWPITLPVGALAKVMADMDGDGKMEIIALSRDTLTVGGAEIRRLYVIRGDGSLMASWDLPACEVEGDRPRTFPAVANLDGDPALEIVAVYDCNTIAMFDLDEKSGPVWKTKIDGTFIASPVIGDLDLDGAGEIVIGSFDAGGNATGGVYAFDRLGKLVRGWPVLQRESFAGPAALADFDGDGFLEVVIPSWSSRKVHLLRRNGFEAPGWPVATENEGAVKSGVTVGDVDGDERADVLLVAPGSTPRAVRGGDLSFLTSLRAWRFDGGVIDLHGAEDIRGPVLESSGGDSRLKSAPVVVCDLDGNGKLDLLVASIQDARYSVTSSPARLKRRSSLYAWELGVPFDPEHAHWPQWQGNPGHDGLYRKPPHRNRPPVIGLIPDQTMKLGGRFLPVLLDFFVTDPDHLPSLLFWKVEAKGEIEAIVDPQRVVTVRPLRADWVGEASVTFTVTDPAGASATASARFVVLEQYDPPVAGEDVIETAEDTPVLFSPAENDRDPGGNALTVSVMSRAQFGRIEALGNGRFRYLPAPDFVGEDGAIYTASNGKGGIVLAPIVFRVRPVNDPPEARPDQVVLDEDHEVVIEPAGNDTDVDGDTVRVTEIGRPTHGRLVELPGGGLSYKPEANFNGEDGFEYVIADASGVSSTGKVSILVRPVNDLPVAESQNFTLNRNTSVNVNFRAVDADEETPQFKVLQGPQHGELFTYPSLAEYVPKKGFSGDDRFTYTASDAKGQGIEATVTFTVLDLNNPPTAQSRALTTRINQSLNVKLAVADADGDRVVVRLQQTTLHGALTGEGTNWVYTPDRDFLGEDAFSFDAFDGQTNSALATIKLRVTEVNTAPSAFDQHLATRVNTATNIVLDAFDPEGNPLKFFPVLVPNHGRLEGKMPEIRYVPDRDYAGPDRFSFSVTDGEFESAPGMVVIDILTPNAVPVANDQRFSVLPDVAFPITLDASDADGDTLVCPILKGPRHGRIFGSGVNYTYVPRGQFVGEDVFTYKAWDGKTYSREARIRLNVSPPPAPTAFGFDRIETKADGGVQLLVRMDSGISVVLEESPNLERWTEIATLSVPAPTLFYSVPAQPDRSARFFRLRKTE